MQGVSTFSAKSMQFKSVIGHLMVSVTLNRSLPFHHLNQSSYHSFHIYKTGTMGTAHSSSFNATSSPCGRQMVKRA